VRRRWSTPGEGDAASSTRWLRHRRWHDQVDAGVTTPVDVGTLLSLVVATLPSIPSMATVPVRVTRATTPVCSCGPGSSPRHNRLVAPALVPLLHQFGERGSPPWPCHTSTSVSASAPEPSSERGVPSGDRCGLLSRLDCAPGGGRAAAGDPCDIAGRQRPALSEAVPVHPLGGFAATVA
jgi:hypothetical protein